MPDPFDPYYEWLGIPPNERPMSHYHLLGLPRFENDPKRIGSAADQRLAYLRSLQQGPRGELTQRILNEVSTAARCLLDPHAKAAYDASLKVQSPHHSHISTAPVVTGPMAPVSMSPIVQAPPATAAPPAQSASKSNTVPSPPTRQKQSDHKPADHETDVDVGANRLVVGIGTIGVLMLIGCGLLAFAGWSGWFGRPDSPEISPDTKTEKVATPEDDSPPEIVANRVLQEGDGSIRLSPGLVELQGDAKVEVLAGQTVITQWSTDETIRWQATVVEPGVFQAEIRYASASNQEAGRLSVVTDGRKQEITLRGSGGLGEYVSEQFFVILKRSGVIAIELTPTTVATDGFVRLKSLELTPRPR